MRILPIVSIVVATAELATFAPRARAQSAPATAGDVIHLKNGGQVRGTIVDVIPGSHARIQLATGEIATIPWSDVASVESAARQSAPGAPAAPAPTAPTAPAPTAPTAQKLVHIEASRVVALERQSDNAKVWVVVCSSPCDRHVPASGTYRIAGSGVRASRAFVIDAGTGDRVYIDVDAGSKGWFVGGIVLTSVGGGAAIIGLILALVATDSHITGHDSLATAGLTTAGLGVLGTVAGIVAITSNAKSLATVSSTAPTPTDASRAPTWIATPTVAPKPIVFPAFTATF